MAEEAHCHQTDCLKSVMVPEKVFDTEVIADDFQGLLRCTVCMAAEGGTETREA